MKDEDKTYENETIINFKQAQSDDIISKLRNNIRDLLAMNTQYKTELGKIREAALTKGAFSAATNAEKNRGMAAGLYIDRKIIKTGKLEELSEEELEAKMKKILDDYAPILNAKVVEALPEEVTESSSPSEPKESES